MESIYYEKQEGSLCAQHCLNALLQGHYFTAVDLAQHAKFLDDEERKRMAESGVDTDEYRKFLQQPSGNMDDSGYFSVQVISSCLKVWGLELVPYNSMESKATEAQRHPEKMKAYICNYKDHWFTIRRLAHQWFNLNSLLSGPRLISDTYLGLFLAQLQEEGYSIFVVLGNFPDCEADTILKKTPVKPSSSTNVSGNKPAVVPFQGTGHRLGTASTSQIAVQRINSEDDVDLQRALQLSLEAEENHVNEANLNKQLPSGSLTKQNSLSSGGTSSLSKPSSEEADDAELQTALHLSLQENYNKGKPEIDPDLQRALKLSMDCVENERDPSQIDIEDVRRRRLAFLDTTSSAVNT